MRYRIMTNGYKFWIQEEGLFCGWNDLKYLVGHRGSQHYEFSTWEAAKTHVDKLILEHEESLAEATVVSYHS